MFHVRSSNYLYMPFLFLHVTDAHHHQKDNYLHFMPIHLSPAPKQKSAKATFLS